MRVNHDQIAHSVHRDVAKMWAVRVPTHRPRAGPLSHTTMSISEQSICVLSTCISVTMCTCILCTCTTAACVPAETPRFLSQTQTGSGRTCSRPPHMLLHICSAVNIEKNKEVPTVKVMDVPTLSHGHANSAHTVRRSGGVPQGTAGVRSSNFWGAIDTLVAL